MRQAEEKDVKCVTCNHVMGKMQTKSDLRFDHILTFIVSKIHFREAESSFFSEKVDLRYTFHAKNLVMSRIFLNFALFSRRNTLCGGQAEGIHTTGVI